MSRRAGELVALLRDRGLSLAVAESLTGGMVAAELVSVSGASTVFVGGVVAYATRVKAEVLGVDADLLEREGAIHPRVAEQMAAGVRQLLSADLGLATTGAAGPDPQDGHEPGEVWIAAVTPDGAVSRELRLAGDRESIRRQTADAVLALALGVAAE